jgi:hypothetical protein
MVYLHSGQLHQSWQLGDFDCWVCIEVMAETYCGLPFINNVNKKLLGKIKEV